MTPAPPRTATQLLLRAVRRSGRRLPAFLGLLSLWQVCEAMVPVLIGVVIDRAVDTGDVGQLVLWISVLVGLFAVLSYGYRFGSRVGMRIAQEEMHALRLEVTRRALDPRGVRSDTLPGETVSLATADAEQVGDTFHGVGYAISAFVAIGVSAVVLVRTDPLLALLVLAGAPIVLVVLQVVTPLVARRTRAQLTDLARATGVAADLTRGFRTLKGIGAEDAAAERYRTASRRAQDAGIRAAGSFGVVAALTTTLSGGFLALVACLAGLMALRDEISIGQLVAIVGLSQFLAEPMRFLGAISADVAASYGAAGRLVAYLHAPALLHAGEQRPADAVLVLDDVRCGPLHGVSITSRPGELLGVACTSPAEAETLLALLTGERAPDSGRVLLGGAPLTELDHDARRTTLLVAPHHVDLFEGTLASNVDPRGDLDDLAVVLEAAAVTDVVSSHAQGAQQPLDPAGGNLSGGQRQRIAFARALAARTPLVVLHDPSTAVDSATEHRMARGLRELRGASTLTTWVLTSSPALLGLADRVVLIGGGRLLAEGPHHELAARPDYQQAVLR